MNVATLAYPSPLTSRVCSLDRWATPLTKLNKGLTEVSYFIVSYFGHSYKMYNVFSFERGKCLTGETVAFGRILSILILRNKFSNIYENTKLLPTQKLLDSVLSRNFRCIYYENFEDYCVYFRHVSQTVNFSYLDN